MAHDKNYHFLIHTINYYREEPTGQTDNITLRFTPDNYCPTK